MQALSYGVIVKDVRVSLNPGNPTPFAVVDFGGFRLFVENPADGQRLVAAAVKALHLIAPDMAQEAVARLVADLLDTAFPDDPGLERVIRAGKAIDVSARFATPDLSLLADCGVPAPVVISADVQVCFWCGTEGTGMRRISVVPEGVRWECADAEACRHGNAAFADAAQPPDLPIPSCVHCGHDAESVPLVLVDGEWECHNRGLCDARQADARIAARRAGMS